MKWTQKELEALYSKVNERALKDPEFKEKVIKDVRGALEEVAGCELPEELGLKYIEKDNSYKSTFVTPDFAQGEIDVNELKSVGGGAGGAAQSGNYKNKHTNSNDVSVFLIVSICGAAAQIGPDSGVCGIAACPADACGAQACGVKACAGYACAADGCGEEATATDACGAKACGERLVGAKVCGVDMCAADFEILGFCPAVYACGADAYVVSVCDAQVCGADSQVLNFCNAQACGAKAAGADFCTIDARVAGACGAKAEIAGACGADICASEACGIEACGAEACGVAIDGTGIEYVNVCGVDATVLEKPLGYDIPSAEIDVCAAQFDGIVSDDAVVNDAE